MAFVVSVAARAVGRRTSFESPVILALRHRPRHPWSAAPPRPPGGGGGAAVVVAAPGGGRPPPPNSDWTFELLVTASILGVAAHQLAAYDAKAEEDGADADGLAGADSGAVAAADDASERTEETRLTSAGLSSGGFLGAPSALAYWLRPVCAFPARGPGP